MTAIMLERVGNNIFKTTKFLDEANVEMRDLLETPQRFILAAKMCDGTLHKVSSEVSNVFKLAKDKIKRGMINDVVNELVIDELAHGQRYVIFEKSSKEAYLLGDVFSALNKFRK